MQWYVSNAGKTVGPVSAEDVQAGIRDGRIDASMHVRDEHGQWMPIVQSPFAGLFPKDEPKPAEKKTLSKREAAGCGCLTVLVVGLLATFISMDDDEAAPEKTEAKEERPQDPRLAAWVMCQELVKSRLKSPASADFGSIFDGELQTYSKAIKVLPNNEFSCVGWVDSQNSFGAQLRTKYDLVLRQDGDSWTIKTINEFE